MDTKMLNFVVQPAITWFDLTEQLSVRLSPTRKSLPKDALPTSELQRLLVIGIGEEGFQKWIDFSKDLPSYYRGTQLEIAKKYLNAEDHFRWFSGDIPKQKINVLLGCKDKLPPAVALPWLQHIIQTINY